MKDEMDVSREERLENLTKVIESLDEAYDIVSGCIGLDYNEPLRDGCVRAYRAIERAMWLAWRMRRYLEKTGERLEVGSCEKKSGT